MCEKLGGGEVPQPMGYVLFRTVNSGPNPKYFGTGRGITYYNFTGDQFTGLHGLVIPGTLRDFLYLMVYYTAAITLDNQKTGYIATDRNGGLNSFWIQLDVRYEFSQRMKASLVEREIEGIFGDPQADEAFAKYLIEAYETANK